jgi:CMP-N,N'-diacetyllegionaminic acid synthase
MKDDKNKLIAIIPARSGSKGLKDKNIRLLAGKPLIVYSILAAQKSNIFDEIFVSTDSLEYANIAKEYGASVPFLRNASLATDTASSWDVLKNALIQYQELGYYFETVFLLQPTSPLRTEEDIKESFKLFKEKRANAVISVCETDHSPLWCNILPEDHSLINFIHNSVIDMPRQLLKKYYRINGALYLLNVNYLFNNDNIYKERCFAYVMPKLRSVDIDDQIDLLFAETVINNYLQ